MIPYDDLVIALQTWRAKQGLPVAQMSGALTPPPVVAPPAAPAFVAQSPGSGPGKAPPGPPPGRPGTPPPIQAADEELHEDVDGALIEEAAYDNEGGDFAMAFGQEQPADAEQAIADDDAAVISDGGTEVASPGARRTTNHNNDW